jgi:hypothetical protein
MVEIHFKTFSPLAAASASVVITAQSAPTGVVRSQVVKRGAVIRGVLSVQWSPCHSSPRAADSVGEWSATTAAPVKAGALTRLKSVFAYGFRVVYRLLIPARRQHHAPSRLHRQPLTLHPRLLRRLAQVRARHTRRQAGVLQNGAAGTRATSTGSSFRASERARTSQTPYNNSLTSDFSSSPLPRPAAHS